MYKKIIPATLFSFLVILGVFMLLVYSKTFESFIFYQMHDSVSTLERKQVSTAVRNYLNEQSELPRELFTEREILHMADVRNVFLTICGIGVALVILLVIIIVVFPYSFTKKILRKTARSAFLVSLVGGVLGAIFFDPVFTFMHTIFFQNDYWLLDPSLHKLIQVYQGSFFLLFFVYYLVIVELIFFWCGWLIPFKPSAENKRGYKPLHML